ncbi:MAG: class I SAM-dependent methyltransferase [Sphingomonadales bacterium]
MSPLGKHLAALIRSQGPITIARYMAEALGNPRHGYYMTRDPLGQRGDFTTAPEISQIFGELLGLWCAIQWQRMGRPDPVHLVELGPGRGTLMVDALRAARSVSGFTDAIQLHLVEMSPALKTRQAERLHATWHDRFEDVPEGPVLLIANEFFDALPIHQFARTEAGWRERMVGLDESGEQLTPFLAPGAGATAALIPQALTSAPIGGSAEVCPAGLTIAEAIGRRVARFGGSAAIIDYGHALSAPGDTLQALRGHRYHGVFQDPGQADLTAHVDFQALARSAQEAGAAVHGPVEQGSFLRALGIDHRARALSQNASAKQRQAIADGVARLTSEDQMGRLFKVMAISDPALPAPEGFSLA